MSAWVKGHKLAIIFFVLIAGVAGLAVAGVRIADRPGFCGVLCHEMQYYVNSLERSQHTRNTAGVKVICMDCHAEPGFIGHAVEHIKASLLLAPHFNESYKVDNEGVHRELSEAFEHHTCQECHPGRAKEAMFMHVPKSKYEVINENCQRCHKDVKSLSESKVREISITHNLHKERNILCTQCHKLVIHGTDPQGFNRPDMHVCFKKCHDDKKAPRSNCGVCHSVPAKMLAGTGGKGVADTAGVMTGEVECKDCHIQKAPNTRYGIIRYDFDPQSCVDCHSNGYDAKVVEWQRDYQDKLAKLEGRFKEISKKAQGITNSEYDALLKQAEYNLELVKHDQSKGVHNPQYIDALAASVNAALDRVEKKKG